MTPAPALSVGLPAPWLLALGGWLLAGAMVAMMLRRGGEAPQTWIAAIPAWPLFLSLLPLLQRAGSQEGPFHPRILPALRGLQAAMREAGISDLEGSEPQEIQALRQALCRADQRIGRMGRLLAEEREMNPAAPLSALEQAIARAGAELEQTLSEMSRLRVQLRLMPALTPDSDSPILPALQGLTLRLQAMEEVR